MANDKKFLRVQSTPINSNAADIKVNSAEPLVMIRTGENEWRAIPETAIVGSAGNTNQVIAAAVTVEPNYGDIIDYLFMNRWNKQARLLRFMRGRPEASKAAIEDELYEGEDTSWETIVSLVRRTAEHLSMCVGKPYSADARRIKFTWSDVDFNVKKTVTKP
jgi:hypothetical protein